MRETHRCNVNGSAHLVRVGVVEKVGPVGIRLHEPELKQLSETQLQDVEADLQRRTLVFTTADKLWRCHETFTWHVTESLLGVCTELEPICLKNVFEFKDLSQK